MQTFKSKQDSTWQDRKLTHRTLPTHELITGGSCHKNNFCRDKRVFVGKKHVFCRDKCMLVVTKYFWRDKTFTCLSREEKKQRQAYFQTFKSHRDSTWQDRKLTHRTLPTHKLITGGSCRKYNFCRDKTRQNIFGATKHLPVCHEKRKKNPRQACFQTFKTLSRQKCARRNKSFVVTKLCLSRQNIFVVTKVQNICHNKDVFVATKMILGAAPASDVVSS